jgi:hypothetical protein
MPGSVWPEHLFGPHKILNLAKSGAGNNYISNSILYNLDYKPDFVFVLWSGINRIDLRVPASPLYNLATENNSSYAKAQIGESLYFMGGYDHNPERGWLAGYQNIKSPDWPEIKSLSDWFGLPDEIKQECLAHDISLSTKGGKENILSFAHQYFLTQCMDNYKDYRSEVSFQHIATCFSMLEKFNIPYRFGFIYDIWNKNEYFIHGLAVKNKYYHMIDWTKFIDLPPFQFGIKHDLLSEDQYHLTKEGMIAWSDEIKKIISKDPELEFLF